jgi:hypothetical protein
MITATEKEEYELLILFSQLRMQWDCPEDSYRMHLEDLRRWVNREPWWPAEAVLLKLESTGYCR